MLANNTGIRTGYMAGKFPGQVGHLFSPEAQRGPYEFCPYALDNGAFGHDDDWTPEPWVKLLDWARLSGQRPSWALVPDRVGDRDATLARWDEFSPMLSEYGWPLAFAVQDGMTKRDVPPDASVIFVGGSTKWKWDTYRQWCADFPRVHIGRVNTYRRLWDCHDAGAESTDGTGFMRGDQVQERGLMVYFEESSGIRKRVVQPRLTGVDGGVYAVSIC